jgi:hypothetical protein
MEYIQSWIGCTDGSRTIHTRTTGSRGERWPRSMASTASICGRERKADVNRNPSQKGSYTPAPRARERARLIYAEARRKRSLHARRASRRERVSAGRHCPGARSSLQTRTQRPRECRAFSLSNSLIKLMAQINARAQY